MDTTDIALTLIAAVLLIIQSKTIKSLESKAVELNRKLESKSKGGFLDLKKELISVINHNELNAAFGLRIEEYNYVINSYLDYETGHLVELKCYGVAIVNRFDEIIFFEQAHQFFRDQDMESEKDMMLNYVVERLINLGVVYSDIMLAGKKERREKILYLKDGKPVLK